MDNIEDILYVIFLVVFLLFRLFKKSAGEKQSAPHSPQAPSAPPVAPEKNLMDVIREEMERQKELNKKKSPIKQKSQQFKKQKKQDKPASPAEFLPPQWSSVVEGESIDYVGKEEGESSFTGKMKHVITEEQEEKRFEFDPREAFMMKTLLERPYA